MVLAFDRSERPSCRTLAERAHHVGQPNVAGRYRHAARTRNPNDPPLHGQSGYTLKESGKLTEAAYRQALANHSGAADVHLARPCAQASRQHRQRPRLVLAHLLPPTRQPPSVVRVGRLSVARRRHGSREPGSALPNGWFTDVQAGPVDGTASSKELAAWFRR